MEFSVRCETAASMCSDAEGFMSLIAFAGANAGDGDGANRGGGVVNTKPSK